MGDRQVSTTPSWQFRTIPLVTRTQPSLVGTLLERRYRVDRLLARGGMSSVYRGTDTRLDRPVAIKIMDPRFADDRSFVERFVREARSAAQLHHPNVVAVHDQGFDVAPGSETGLAFLVMELVDGGTLRELLTAHGPLDVPLALTIAEPVLSALAAAHRAGLVHRDVKPENVLIGRGGTSPGGGVVKVADFGLVRAVASAGTTSSSVILGTVAYVAPEQVATGATTARGDVYAAGILLYEMLTGRAPHRGDTAISVAYQHVNTDVPPPSELRPGLPPQLDALILRATRRDPELRPADAGEFLVELNALRDELGIAAVGVPVPPPPDAEAASDQDLTTPGIPRVIPEVERTMPVMAPVAATRVQPRPGAPLTASPDPLRAGPPPRRRSAEPEKKKGPDKRKIIFIAAGVLLFGCLIGAFAFILTDTGGAKTSTVPKLVGLNQAAAGDALRAQKLTPQFTEEYDNTAPAHTVLRSDPAEGATMQPNASVAVVLSKGRPIVPDIQAGTALTDAEKQIRDARLTPVQGSSEFSDVSEGSVVRTEPGGGSQLNIDGQVKLILSKGPLPLPPVPDVTGRSKDEAFQILRQNGFDPFQAGEEFNENVAAGSVTRTDPQAGSTATKQKIGVFVSNAVEVPSVIFKSFGDAKKIIEDAGLKFDREGRGNGNGNGNGGGGGFDLVFQQDPQPGTKVQKGTTVHVKGFG